MAFVQKGNDPLDSLANSLDQWSEKFPQEKVYLHMDKPYYAIGDTIWFKSYVTTGSRHQLSAISGALYVDLINEKDSIVSLLKLPLNAGMSMGNFTLKDDLKEGNYRIRAYTQWMRNAGKDYFFDHTFTVVNPFENSVIAKADYSYIKTDGKQFLNATLNYTDDTGAALVNRKITYEIIAGNDTLFTKTRETDGKGNIMVNIPADKIKDWSGAIIKTNGELADRTKFEKQFPIKANLSQSDIQFFPESGSLVYGVTSRLAFKTVGIDGNGLFVKGEVVDQEQDPIVDFTSGYAGMGSFLFRPETGKVYTAKITFADGSQKSVALPTPITNGYVLSVIQPNADSILVRIKVPEQMFNDQTALNVNCLVHSGGEIIASTPLRIKKAITSFWLEKKAFPSGIAQFTLFSATGEPLNERIAFIKTKDQLTLKLNTTKQIYKSKERVELQLEAMDSDDLPTEGNFSLAVIDESKVPFDDSRASTIFSNLLLTSDIKGYVENPNYYFTADNGEVNRSLDNLMLTQGYRRFLWSDLKSGNILTPAFKAEGFGTYISGKVVTLGNKPAANATVTLMSVRANLVKGTKADADGRFKFDGMFLTDSLKFSIQARAKKKSNKVEVILDTVPKLATTKNRNIGALNTDLYRSTKSYADNGKQQDEILEKLGGMSRTRRLKEVNIVARKYQENLPKQRNFNQNGPGKYDQIIKNEELQSCPHLHSCLSGRITGVTFRSVLLSPNLPAVTLPFTTRAPSGDMPIDDKPYPGAMMVVLDGIPYAPTERNANIYGSIFDFNDPMPEQIATIEVLRSVGYTNIYGPDAQNGVILITTKNGGNHAPAYNPSIVNFSPKSFDKTKEFYTPRYDRPGSNLDLPDLRSTIYWDAGLKILATGKTRLNFFNPDGPGTYKVILEGINADGQLGRQVYKYTVSDNVP
ncbi:TonB-dependent receptor [Pedobacter sp. PWIIR3]